VGGKKEEEAMKRLILFAILLNVVLAPVCLAQPDQMTVQGNRAEALQLVDKYTQALDSTASFIDHYELTGEYSGRFPPGHPYYQVDESEGFPHKILRRGVYKFKEDKGWYDLDYSWGYVDSEHMNVPEDKARYNLLISAMDFTYYRTNSHRCKWDRDIRETLGPSHCSVGISHLLGYVDVEERLDKVLRRAKYISVRDGTETIRGSECFVVDAHTKYGQFSLWLDPNHGYHAAKIRRTAKAGEYFTNPDRLVPAGSIATGYLDVLEFKRIDGIWVPVDANAGFHRTIGNPVYYMDEDHRYKRTQIILNPDHDKLGSFADPIFEDSNNDPKLVNGMLAKIDMGDHHVQYTWQDGKLIDRDGVEADLDELRVQADRYWAGRRQE
jgi:hypothetical protein